MLGCSSCHMSMISLTNPPAFSPPRTFSLPTYFREQGSSMVRCFACLFRWAAADDMIVWSALPSTDHPAGSCCHNDQWARQETGNRKKKAGHPVHLDKHVKHDITKASLLKGRIPDQMTLFLARLSSNAFLSASFCVFASSCASVFSVCLFSPHTDTVFQTAPSSQTSNPSLFSVRRKGEKKYTHFHLNIHQQQPHKLRQKK